jgi:hypothetical protein
MSKHASPSSAAAAARVAKKPKSNDKASTTSLLEVPVVPDRSSPPPPVPAKEDAIVFVITGDSHEVGGVCFRRKCDAIKYGMKEDWDLVLRLEVKAVEVSDHKGEKADELKAVENLIYAEYTGRLGQALRDATLYPCWEGFDTQALNVLRVVTFDTS